MTFGSRSGRAVVWAAALLVLAVGAGCGKEEALPGSAEIQVSLSQGLAAADVTRVRVEVRGPGISPSLTEELVKGGGGWQGSVTGIPAGTARVIEATAYNATGEVLYEGSSAPLSIVSGATVSVLLTLQPLEVTPPYENEPPEIDSVVASANTVLPSKSISLVATAHDPNGDALSYAWTAPAGTFSAPAAASTTWTAPATEGVRRLRLDVTDARGTSASVEFDVAVQVDGATGNAQVTVGFNTWPRVTALGATPAVLELGKTVQLASTAVDADGNTLSYSWGTFDCPGFFSDPSAPSPQFTLFGPSPSGRCSLRLMVSDGAGGQHTGTLILRIGSAPQVNVVPKIDNFWQSATLVNGGQLVTVGVSAHDPEGKSVGFSWSAPSGWIEATRWTSGSGEADWRAPACFDTPVSITATVLDADGASTQHVFSVAPSESAKCGPSAVSGVRRVINVQPDGSTIVTPFDLSAVALGAWVPTADGSGYDYRAGSAQADGTFVIPGVDRVPYLLRYGSSYYWMTSRSLDLSGARLGRPDVVAEAPGTRLSLALSGLVPWQEYQDDLQLFSSGAGIAYQSKFCVNFDPEPTQGATDLAATLDYREFFEGCGNTPAPRISPEKGDVVHASQHVSRVTLETGFEVSYTELLRSAPVSVATSPPEVILSGTLAPLPVSNQRFDFRASQYESLLLGLHADAKIVQKSLNVGTMPRFMEYGQYAGYPDLGIANNYTAGQGDFFVQMVYGNPYPSAWPRITTSSAFASIPFSVALAGGGTSTPVRYTVGMYTQEKLRDGETQLVTPRVGPPREPRLNGLDATGTLTGVGQTPLLSWTAPALGTPVRYQLRLYEIYATGSGGTARLLKTNFYTAQTQLRLPPGFLIPGKTYFFQMTAYAIPGLQENKPFLIGPEYHYAGRFSGVFSP